MCKQAIVLINSQLIAYHSIKLSANLECYCQVRDYEQMSLSEVAESLIQTPIPLLFQYF